MRRKTLDYESSVQAAHCPSCGSTAVVVGKLAGGDSRGIAFVPANLKSFALTFTSPGVRFKGEAFVCSDCGFLWCALNVAKLRQVLARWRKDRI